MPSQLRLFESQLQCETKGIKGNGCSDFNSVRQITRYSCQTGTEQMVEFTFDDHIENNSRQRQIKTYKWKTLSWDARKVSFKVHWDILMRFNYKKKTDIKNEKIQRKIIRFHTKKVNPARRMTSMKTSDRQSSWLHVTFFLVFYFQDPTTPLKRLVEFVHKLHDIITSVECWLLMVKLRETEDMTRSAATVIGFLTIKMTRKSVNRPFIP